MLHDGHKLDGVVPCLCNSGKHVLPEFIIGGHPEFLTCHAHMRLIDKRCRGLSAWPGVLPHIRNIRRPDLRIENKGRWVLDHPCCPCRDPVSLTARPPDKYPVQVFVPQNTKRHFQFPINTIDSSELERVKNAPIRKFTNQIYFSCVG